MDLAEQRQIAAQINFDVPRGYLTDDVFDLGEGVWGVGLVRYERMFVTVFDVFTPPADSHGAVEFPTDVLVIHASPRRLTNFLDTRNFDRWRQGRARYWVSGEGVAYRAWSAPRDWACPFPHTYLHMNASLPGLKRGDVLCLTGTTIQFASLGDDTLLHHDVENSAVVGTSDCPWFMVESVDIYRDWPCDRPKIDDPYGSLMRYLATSAPHLLAAPGKPLELPGSM